MTCRRSFIPIVILILLALLGCSDNGTDTLFDDGDDSTLNGNSTFPIGNVIFLEDDPRFIDYQSKYAQVIDIIEEEADRLSQLIENLLDATRLQAGGVSLKKSEIFLPGISSRLAKKFQTQTEVHEIITDFPKEFPTCLADETRIEQVIINSI